MQGVFTIKEYRFDFDYSRQHFIQRLFERYAITLTGEEYDELHSMPNRQKQRIWRGCFLNGYSTSIGILKLKGMEVVCVYDSKNHVFRTALPIETAHSVESAILACFKKQQHAVAFLVYEKIKVELQNECKDFDNIKDAAMYYYENSNYPSLLISCFKHGKFDAFAVCRQIQKIIDGTHSKVRLTLEKIPAGE